MNRFWEVVLVLIFLPVAIVTTAQQCDINQVSEILAQVQNACQDTGRNQVCFGNKQLSAEPSELVVNIEDFQFSEVGDIEDLVDISTIDAADFEEGTGTFGVALIRMQANIPNTLPGQNVTFLIFGDTDLSIDNPDAENGLQAVSLSTGIGRTTCNDVPRSGLIVQTPRINTTVEFTLNGINVVLGSTAMFWTENSTTTYAGLFEGHTWLTQNGHTEDMGAGWQIRTDQFSSPQPKTPFVYNSDPALTNVWNWVDNVSFTDQPCQIEVFDRTYVRIAPGRAAFRVVDNGVYDVIGKQRNGDQMSWQIDKDQIEGGYNALQLWMTETNPSTFRVVGNCDNIADTVSQVPIVQPTQAPQIVPTVFVTPEIPAYGSIYAEPTHLDDYTECTVIYVSVFHATRAQLYVPFLEQQIAIPVEAQTTFDLCNVPTGSSNLSLQIWDLNGNQIPNLNYVITRASGS